MAGRSVSSRCSAPWYRCPPISTSAPRLAQTASAVTGSAPSPGAWSVSSSSHSPSVSGPGRLRRTPVRRLGVAQHPGGGGAPAVECGEQLLRAGQARWQVPGLRPGQGGQPVAQGGVLQRLRLGQGHVLQEEPDQACGSRAHELVDQAVGAGQGVRAGVPVGRHEGQAGIRQTGGQPGQAAHILGVGQVQRPARRKHPGLGLQHRQDAAPRQELQQQLGGDAPQLQAVPGPQGRAVEVIAQVQQPLHRVGQRQGDPRDPERACALGVGLPLHQREGAEVGQPLQDGEERLRGGRARVGGNAAAAPPRGAAMARPRGPAPRGRRNRRRRKGRSCRER